MALRVLLADESSTIKKVMQLALQDFGVEVKSVPNGLDVLPVTKSYKPDIIFADVLLTKKSGYDICNELQEDAASSEVPVVLMWSGFMDLDEQKFLQCKARGRLEKPFDAATLRSLVSDLVPKTKTNSISAFLKFPKLPEFVDSSPMIVVPPPAQTAHPPLDSNTGSEENNSGDSELALDDFMAEENVNVNGDDFFNYSEEFTEVPLHPTEKKLEPVGNLDEGDQWSQESLSKFKIKDDPVQVVRTQPSFVLSEEEDDLENLRIEADGEFEEIQFENKTKGNSKIVSANQNSSAVDLDLDLSEELVGITSPAQGPTQSQTHGSAQSHTQGQGVSAATHIRSPQISEEKLLKEARGIIESICWRILPDITEKLVREEIQKLLRETEKNESH